MVVFFFKQKTAYEMRISDWSSDVCSSDLALGGAEQLRAAGDVAVADDADPLALFQRLDDVAVHRDAADLLDPATGDRLAVGDQGQGFERGAGVFGLALGPQPRHPGVHVLLDLVAPAGGTLCQSSEERRVGKVCVRT